MDRNSLPVTVAPLKPETHKYQHKHKLKKDPMKLRPFGLNVMNVFVLILPLSRL